MLLSEILKNTNAQTPEGFPDMEIADIACDSRKVTKNALFVAIKGFKSDGHKFIDKALEMGAAVVAGEEEYDADNYIRVPNSRQFLAVASANFFGNPAKKMKIVGITGTNGKTTVSYLIKQIIELKGYKCSLIGTNQIIIGNEAVASERTTPESRDLQELFCKMAAAGSEYVVMEVSSHSLELDRVYGIEFECGIFTNLTQDHLDFHITMDNYAGSKAKLFKVSKNAVINTDDKYSNIMLEQAKNVICCSVKGKGDLCAENIRMSERGVIFDAVYKGERQMMRLGIPGEFSVYNALSACGGALCLGFSLEDIEKGLVLARGVKGRLEVVPTLTPYTVIIDYAHTPDGLENVLRAVRGFAKGRVIALFGCGGDRDNKKRSIMGSIAEDMADFAVVTSDNPRSEEPGKIIDDILTGMKKDNHVVVENRKEAIEYALKIAKEGDVVVLAGKGHETYQILKDETIHFDEREIVKEILSNK